MFRARAGVGRTRLTVLLLVVTLVLPRAGRAADEADNPSDGNSPMPRCGPAMDGQVYCKFGVVHECQLIGPNSMERRTGWRWKADILRGCQQDKPATVDHWGAVPPIVTYVPSYSDRPCPGPGARSDDTPAVGIMRVHPDTPGCR
jgi:hypothetical protein